MPFILSHCPANEEWEKTFSTKDEARQELLKHICKACLLGGEWEDFDENGITQGVVNIDEPPDQNDIYALLDTPCGCEYHFEEAP